MSGWMQDLKRAFPHAKLDEPMRKHTTFRIGGPADAYVEVSDADELARLAAFARERKVGLFIVGFGSNLLILDGGIRGIVVRLRGAFETMKKLGGTRVWAGAAVRLPKLVTFCASHDLAGSEPLVGVPGTVGGAVMMNAGTRLGEIGALVRELELMSPDGSLVKRAGGSVDFKYRSSGLEGELVLAATLELKAGDKADIMRRVDELQRHRARTQPIHTFNVGSIFKNPPGRFVAQLIEELGLKGKAHGGARISPLHANFIENHDDASAADVLALVELARTKVRERFGVELELEMKIAGEA